MSDDETHNHHHSNSNSGERSSDDERTASSSKPPSKKLIVNVANHRNNDLHSINVGTIPETPTTPTGPASHVERLSAYTGPGIPTDHTFFGSRARMVRKMQRRLSNVSSRKNEQKALYANGFFSFSAYHSDTRSLAEELDETSEETNKMEMVRAKERSRRQKSPYAINPQGTKYSRWELVVGLALVITAFITPYEAAFADMKDLWRPLFILNRYVDAVFIADLVTNFFVAYHDVDIYVYNLALIRWRYATRWMLPDILCSIPFDLIAAGLHETTSFMRILRMVRVVKIMNNSRFKRLLTRLEMFINVFDYHNAAFDVMCFVFLACVSNHWLACTFALIVRVEKSPNNWMVNYYLPDDHVVGLDFDVEYAEVTAITTNFSRWLASVYWALATTTTIGYGDVVAVTKWELIISSVCMLFGGFQFGYLISQVSNILVTWNHNKQKFRRKMQNLNALMNDADLPTDLRQKLRDFFTFKDNLTDHTQWSNLLDEMSPALRGHTARAMEQMLLERVPIFSDCSTPCIVALKMRMEVLVFPAAETITRVGEANDRLYIIKKGLVGIGNVPRLEGKSTSPSLLIKGEGSLLCESSLYKENLVQNYRLKAVTFCCLFSMDRSTILTVLRRFPKEEKLFRKRALQRVFRDEVMAYTCARKLQTLFLKDSNTKIVPISLRVMHYLKKIQRLHFETAEAQAREELLIRLMQRHVRAMLKYRRENGLLRSQQPTSPTIQDVPALTAALLRETHGMRKLMSKVMSGAANFDHAASSSMSSASLDSQTKERLRSIEKGQARLEHSVSELQKDMTKIMRTIIQRLDQLP